jgi:hypothetical protein
MLNNGYFVPLKLLYEQIWNYKDKSKIIWKTPDMTIQAIVQRDPRFTRIWKWVYALTDFLEKVEREDLWYFTVNEKNEIVFKNTNKVKEKKFDSTEKYSQLKIRKWQSYFRELLLKEMKCCPITWIDDKKILVASHIKPWAHSNNEERLNVKNWILLSPLFDKLFDKWIWLITFTLEKKILISNKLSKDNILRLNVNNKQIIENLNISWREEFLEYHRKYIFQW